MIIISQIFCYFPPAIYNPLNAYFQGDTKNILKSLEEIRLRAGHPIILKFTEKEQILEEHIVQTEEILETLRMVCENSIYSYQSQICNGYITIKGGHRIGICGSIVIEGTNIINMNYFSSLNFRIAKQVIGCSNKILKYVLDSPHHTIFNTLIVSPPGAGKTTLLRDLIRRISTGFDTTNFHGLTVGVVDERGEIAAMFKGKPQNDIGTRTDVLNNIPKALGMKMLIRSMAPTVIAADEIGSKDDVDAICYAACCGIKGIFTAHGSSLEDLLLNPELNQLLQRSIFERIIILSNQGERGTVEKTYYFNATKGEYVLE